MYIFRYVFLFYIIESAVCKYVCINVCNYADDTTFHTCEC